MLPSEAWEFLERFKDLIGNGLDLLSFLLATPEILRVIQPKVADAVQSSYWLAIVVLYLLVGPILINWASSYLEHGGMLSGPAKFLFVTVFVVTFAGIANNVGNRFVPSFGTALAQHCFMLGIALFLLARALGFLLAAHDELGLQ